MNSFRQLPRTYVPFALLTMFGPLLIILLQGDSIHPSAAGLAFVALLLLGLARGSLLAWGLLLAWNLFLAFAIAAVLGSEPGGGWLFPSAPLSVLLALVSVALLLSPSMRRHVRGRPPRASDPHQATG